MKIYFSQIFLLIFLIGKLSTTAQTIYGVSGQIKTPDANIATNGKCTMGILYFSDYHEEHDNFVRQWSLSFNTGFMSRIELGVRLLVIPGAPGDSEIYDSFFDRIVNVKALLLEESEYIPAFAFGMQDIVGTRMHNSTYFVAGKKFVFTPFLSFNLNLGYGTELNELIFDDAYDHHFLGIFGSGRLLLFEKISFSAEYDSENTNMGIIYSGSKWFKLKLLLLDMESFSGGISLTFTL